MKYNDLIKEAEEVYKLQPVGDSTLTKYSTCEIGIRVVLKLTIKIL